MDDKVKKTIWWSLTVLFGGGMLAWTWLGTPTWWEGAVALAGMIVTFFLGKPWKAPEAP